MCTRDLAAVGNGMGCSMLCCCAYCQSLPAKKQKAEKLLFPTQSKILAQERCDPEGKQNLELLKSFQGLEV